MGEVRWGWRKKNHTLPYPLPSKEGKKLLEA